MTAAIKSQTSGGKLLELSHHNH